MNPRRVHELMQQQFPGTLAATRDWVVAADERGLRREAVRGLMSKYIGADEMLIEVHRRIGDFLPADASEDWYSTASGKRDQALRDFGGLIVAVRSVATSWTPGFY